MRFSLNGMSLICVYTEVFARPVTFIISMML